ncbi:hypothetical protein JHD46_01180 [Sulfurimonas sp. SAG-AH-194-C20]|nr:PP0621 family protein [Sulfurimonas sp. SAG-AH-194-C20]MDF1878245.1 hypothetical protein [Sulfurimonas sp. SAG-AH-194-C20]
MILKVLLVIGVIGIVYFMFIKKKPTISQKNQAKAKKNEEKADDMVECSSCGVYAEVSESILSNAKYYCSQECVVKAA